MRGLDFGNSKTRFGSLIIMCGVAGIVKLNNRAVEYQHLKTFTDSISHRGPDGSGYELFEEGRVGLGHRRLSILDLSEAGKQPMFDATADHCITFNGEIYNFIEVRNELKLSGFSFHTESDTEVILAAYRQWGKNCLHKFNGMFAIAIWDRRHKELFVARDRFGVKPLYYWFLPGELFAFCSETIGFKHLHGYRRQIEPVALNLALYDPALLEGSDKTIFKNIYQLLPGHYLTLNLNGNIKTTTWWCTKEQVVKAPDSYNEQLEEFKELFESACRLRLRSDVPIASALSGGLDSSSVYATLHKINNGNSAERLPADWQRAFVATFPGTSVDERQYAEKVITHVGGKATYIVPDYSRLVDEVVTAAKLFDGVVFTPVNAISDVYKAMRQNGVTVSMDGHGVDEMMYGYNTYVYKAFYHALRIRDFEFAEDLAKTLCGLSLGYDFTSFKTLIEAERGKTILRRTLSDIKQTFHTSKGEEGRKYIQHGIPLPDSNLVNEIVKRQTRLGSAWPAENKLYEDFHYIDLPINLRDFDRASMQHGIEIRMPFMDYRLVSYVFSLPERSKVGHGFTKRILRDAMKQTLPEEIRTRTLKIGIAGPDAWYTNQLKPLILDVIASRLFIESDLWNGPELKKMVEAGYKNNTLNKTDFNLIWGLMSTCFLMEE